VTSFFKVIVDRDYETMVKLMTIRNGLGIQIFVIFQDLIRSSNKGIRKQRQKKH
jgi:hypothetical protein